MYLCVQSRGLQPLGHRLMPVHGLLGTGLPSRRLSGEQAGQASSVFTATPHHSHRRLSSGSRQISVALDSHRSMNPSVNCACEGSRLHSLHENLLPMIRFCIEVSCGYFIIYHSVTIREIKNTINVMRPSSSPWFVEKSSSTKPVPSAETVEDRRCGARVCVKLCTWHSIAWVSSL